VSTSVLLPSPQRGRNPGYTPASVDGVSSRSPQEVRVLIVEDEWLVSMETEAVLVDAGYQVVGTAASGDEAVHLVEIHGPDLVLMDIRLQGTRDGIDAAAEINCRFGVRSLFVSAHVDAGTQERGRATNPLGWLSKPFSGPQLLLAMQSALRSAN